MSDLLGNLYAYIAQVNGKQHFKHTYILEKYFKVLFFVYSQQEDHELLADVAESVIGSCFETPIETEGSVLEEFGIRNESSTLNQIVKIFVCAVRAVDNVVSHETEKLKKVWAEIRLDIALYINELNQCTENSDNEGYDI